MVNDITDNVGRERHVIVGDFGAFRESPIYNSSHKDKERYVCRLADIFYEEERSDVAYKNPEGHISRDSEIGFDLISLPAVERFASPGDFELYLTVTPSSARKIMEGLERKGVVPEAILYDGMAKETKAFAEASGIHVINLSDYSLVDGEIMSGIWDFYKKNGEFNESGPGGINFDGLRKLSEDYLEAVVESTKSERLLDAVRQVREERS